MKYIPQSKKLRLDFLSFSSVKFIHKSINVWLVILKSKIKDRKDPNKIKLTWWCFVKNFIFDSLFLVNLYFYLWDFCVFWKGIMYGYLYCENGGLEQLPDDVKFVSNLNINAENLHFLFFWNPTCVHRLMPAYASSCLRTQA